MTQSTEASLRARHLVARLLGLDFPDGRWPDLQRGLARAAHTAGEQDIESYLERLEGLPPESPDLRHLASHLTVGETYFFRDRACFAALEREILPALIAARRADGSRRLRLWSAGCATGEEAYSLAIVLDRLLPDKADWAITILATDINPSALDAARHGLHREWSFRETSEELRQRYFRPKGKDLSELAPDIRRMVTFAPLNLAEDGYPAVATNTSAMDLIFCRNVLMYFTPDARQMAIRRLKMALMDGGWLAVSAVEASQELMRPLHPVNFPGATVYRKERAVAGPSAPDSPPAPTSTDARLIGQRRPANGSVIDRRPAIHAAPFPEPRLTAMGAPVLETAPPATASGIEAAWVLADQGDLEGARRLCDVALGQDVLDPGTYLLLAAIAQERGDLAGAMVAARQAVYLASESASAHFLLGSLLFRQGQSQRARRCMEAVARLLSGRLLGDCVDEGRALTVGHLLEMAKTYLELPL